jgi:hypothetical protein
LDVVASGMSTSTSTSASTSTSTSASASASVSPPWESCRLTLSSLTSVAFRLAVMERHSFLQSQCSKRLRTGIERRWSIASKDTI